MPLEPVPSTWANGSANLPTCSSRSPRACANSIGTSLPWLNGLNGNPPSESGGLSAYLLEDHGFRKMFFKKLMACFFHVCWFCALESCVLSVLFRASRSRKIEIEIIKWMGLKSFMMFGAFSQVPRICISLCKVFLAFLSYKGANWNTLMPRFPRRWSTTWAIM